MAAIVLVHGIDNQRESADLIESTWLPALAGGVRLAGRGDLADRLWPPRSRADSIDIRASYYGHLFREADQQGAGDDLRDLSPDEAILAETIALEWLERIADRAPADSADAVQAQEAFEIARDPEKANAQGAGNILRGVVNTLSRSKMIANLGMGAASKFLIPALVQVTRYLNDPSIRAKAQMSVLNLVGPDTRAIIGHSLGSVVAYECAHLLNQPLPLLVTVGSPLGLRSIVTKRLSPAPSFPPRAEVWLNVANREDVVAAEPDLRSLFARKVPAGSRFEGVWYNESTEPHRAETYLGREAVGRVVIEALSSKGFMDNREKSKKHPT